MAAGDSRQGSSDLADARSALLAYEAERTGRPSGPIAPPPAKAPSAAAGDAPAAPRGKEELLDAWDRLVDHEANKKPHEAPAPRAWRRFVLPIIALVATLGALVLTVARPEWLYPSSVVAPEAIVTDAAAERHAVMAAMLTEEFHEEHGRLPTGPEELGLDAGRLQLVDRGDGRYQVVVQGPTQTFIVEGDTRGAP